MVETIKALKLTKKMDFLGRYHIENHLEIRKHQTECHPGDKGLKKIVNRKFTPYVIGKAADLHKQIMFSSHDC